MCNVDRDVQKKEASMGSEYVTSDYDDMETKSDASDAAFSTNSSSHLESASISQAALSRVIFTLTLPLFLC